MKLAGLAVLGTAAFLVSSVAGAGTGGVWSAHWCWQRLAHRRAGSLQLTDRHADPGWRRCRARRLVRWPDRPRWWWQRGSLLIVFAAFAVTLTTRTSDMLAGDRGIAWRRSISRGLIDAARVSLAVSLVLRFVPDILTRWRDIREAQAARGLASHPVALLVPLLVRTLKGADDVAAAIEARGFPPPRLHPAIDRQFSTPQAARSP